MTGRRRSLAWLIPLTLAGAVAPARADWVASGVFQYIDREYDQTGFTGVLATLPVRSADVEVVDANLTGSGVLAAGATAYDGSFSILVPDNEVRDVYVRAITRSQYTSSLHMDVRDRSGTGFKNYAVATGTTFGHSPSVNVSFGTAVIQVGQGGEPFNIFDQMLSGLDFLAFLAGMRPAAGQHLAVAWSATRGVADSHYVSGSRMIVLRDTAGYDDTVMLHEMGHYVILEYSDTSSPGGAHTFSQCNQDLRLAFDEGWATFWGNSGLRHRGLPRCNIYTRTNGGPGPGNLTRYADLETDTQYLCVGATSELNVASLLWDIVDGETTTDTTPAEDDAHDLLDLEDSQVWEVMTAQIPAATSITLEDFWDGWFLPPILNGLRSEMIQIFDFLGTEYHEDSREANDTTAEAPTLVPNAPSLRLTFFRDPELDGAGAPDVDYFAFSAVAGEQYIVETFDLRSDGNTAVTLLGPDGLTILASNDDRALGDDSSRIDWTATASGRVYVQVAHAPDHGIYGSFSLLVSTANPVDSDVDGHAVPFDCDDADPLTNPAAAETCEGLDNDCDGAIDEGFPDTDGDGQADCVDPDDDNDAVADGADCAPLDATASGVPVEVAGLDVAGASPTNLTFDTQAIGSGTRYQVISGLLARLSETRSFQEDFCAEAGAATGSWRDARPAPRLADGWFYLVRSANACGLGTLGSPQADEPGAGDVCEAGIVDEDADGSPSDLDCNDGDPSLSPMHLEICDGGDNNCDGAADEGLGTTTCGVGACERTVQNCAQGATQACAPGAPEEEACDGADNDCDGAADEELGTTTCGVGACQRTVQNCLEGATQTCAPGAPSAEACNGVDDDCNGVTDDGLPDAEGDGVADCLDNCPFAPNPGQQDLDGDGSGDACDADADSDSFTTTGSGSPLTTLVTSEQRLIGSQTNTYTNTRASDNSYELVRESTVSNVSRLDMRWKLTVPAGHLSIVSVEAHHNASVDADDFVFSYSTDGVNFTDMFLVTKTADNNRQQSFALPLDVNGTITLRALDTNRTSGTSLDTLTVDLIKIMTSDPADCDDLDAAVRPGGAEVCNGADENCDGEADDGFPDVDNDGVTDCLDSSVIIQRRVGASTDDAEESGSGGVSISSSDLELVFDGSNQVVGIRFNSVYIPQGATVFEAWIQFKVDEATSAAASLALQGQAADSASPFLAATGNISSRARTAASVSWSPVAWPTVGAAGADQRTADLSSIIQEIVGRPGWSSGNSLAIIVTGSGKRVAEAFDGDVNGAPLLHVGYVP